MFLLECLEANSRIAQLVRVLVLDRFHILAKDPPAPDHLGKVLQVVERRAGRPCPRLAALQHICMIDAEPAGVAALPTCKKPINWLHWLHELTAHVKRETRA